MPTRSNIHPDVRDPEWLAERRQGIISGRYIIDSLFEGKSR
ncbi:MAG: hypothetical protein ACNA7I_07530 [Candidatus Methanoperedens sp.]|nr:hypothetical protein [Candidatus Methanoperedens sp.]